MKEQTQKPPYGQRTVTIRPCAVNSPPEQTEHNSLTSLNSLVMWNIRKAQEKNPNIILKPALEKIRDRLESACGPSMGPLLDAPQEERHLLCALLAWQKLGHRDIDSLVYYWELRKKNILEGNTSCKYEDPAVQYSTKKHSFLGPVITLPSRLTKDASPFKLPTPAVTRACLPAVDSDIIKKFKDLCCLKPEYASMLERTAAETSEMKQRVEQLHEREARRVELLERAELAWQNLEQGFNRKLQLSDDKDKLLAERLNDALKELKQYEIQKKKLEKELSEVTEKHEEEVELASQTERSLCELALTRHRLSEEAAATAARLTEEHCRCGKKESELKFKEDSMKTKVKNFKNDLESAKMLAVEAERVVFKELSDIKKQIEDQSQQLLKINAKNEEEIQKLNHYKQHKSDLEEELTSCKRRAVEHAEDGKARVRALREEMAALETKVAECRCKQPVEVSLQVRRTASLVVSCCCDSANPSDTNCSCTSLRQKLYSDLLTDLFSGLHSELIRNGSTMPCEVLKCLDENHNWERSPLMKLKLRAYFSQLLVSELDIAIASSIEKYHAKWVGTTCKDKKDHIAPLKKAEVDSKNHNNEFDNECGCTCLEPDPEEMQNIEVERRAMQLIEKMFREQAFKHNECNRPPACKKLSASSCAVKNIETSPNQRIYSCHIGDKREKSKRPPIVKQRATDMGTSMKIQNYMVQENVQLERKRKCDMNYEEMNRRILKISRAWHRDYDCYNANDFNTSIKNNPTEYHVGAKKVVKHEKNISKDINFVKPKVTRSSKQDTGKNKQLDSTSYKKTYMIQPNKSYKKHLTTFDIHTVYESQIDNHSILQETKRKLKKQRNNEPVKIMDFNSNDLEENDDICQEPSCTEQKPCFHKRPSQSSLNKLLDSLNQSFEENNIKSDKINVILSGKFDPLTPKISNLLPNSKDKTDLNQSNSIEAYSENIEIVNDFESRLSQGKLSLNNDDTLENKVTKDIDTFSNKPNKNNNINSTSDNQNSAEKPCISVLGKVNIVTANHDVENSFEKRNESQNITILRNLKTANPINVQSQESEYMGEINLDRSNETCECSTFKCKCHNINKSNNQESTVEYSRINNPIFNKILNDNTTQTSCKTVDFIYSSCMSNDDKIKIVNHPIEPGKVIEQTIHDILKKSEPISLYNDYDINFLGVTLNYDDQLKTLKNNFDANIPILDVVSADNKVKPILRKNYVCKATELNTESLKTLYTSSVGNQVSENHKSKYYKNEKAREKKLAGNKSSNSHSFLEAPQPTSSSENFTSVNCVCCKVKNPEEFKDLEVNAYALLWDHLKGKLEELKKGPNNITYFTKEEENNLFSSILQKVKQVISESTNKIACSCGIETEQEGNWKRAQALLQEYLRTKIQRVKCSCFSNGLEEEMNYNVTELLDKVSKLIENDFERLNIYKKVNQIQSSDKSRYSHEIHNVKTHAATETGDNQINKILKNVSDVTDFIISNNVSCQVSRNFTKDTKSCETDSAKENQIDIGFESNNPEKKEYNCSKVIIIGLDSDPIDIKTSPNKDTDKCKTLELLADDPKLVNDEKDYLNTNTVKSSYMECTIDCSCDINYCIGTCDCTKSKLDEKYEMKKYNSLYNKNIKGISNENSYSKSSNNMIEKVSKSMMNTDSENLCGKTEIELKKPSKHVIISGNECTLQSSLDQGDPCHFVSKGNEAKLLDEEVTDIPKSNSNDDSHVCDCKTVPICHVKMLVDDIENRLARSNCICDSFNPIVCPVHAKK